MVRDRNEVTLIGALAEPPALAVARDGRPRTILTLAGTREGCTTDGRPQTIYWRHRVDYFGAEAHELAHLEIGATVLAEGALRSRVVTDEDGLRRHKVEMSGYRAKVVQCSGRVSVDAYGRAYLEQASNQVTLEGTLARDLSTRHTRAGVPLARSALITRTPDPRDPTLVRRYYIPIVLWGDLAEEHAQAPTGSGLHVDGLYLTGRFVNQFGKTTYHPLVEVVKARAL